ncbi:hypothetical protein AUR64_11725 [Haloprofundus marisrubri]|uniref:Uncharacterized protein n=1 Tax=Haloprofundus marisrubri TaxID=1514971 RepID=A0A0W1RAZ0_9EURY|nr:hypothetical protein AUR64_11725 [Haloprofundus marisrubri]
MFLAVVVYFLGWFAGEFLETGALVGAFSSTRAAVTGVLAALILAYSLLIAQQVLLGVLTVLMLVLVAWLTSPTGPLATLHEQ